ncbi:hypothetical protein [Algoriphagus marincola]|uniref:hypothetical protein n=1 Tax=Algoriphagus marincola TaxID=264027 RepID=UPI0003FD78C6|nr:hypothetical protein [Algoriphagus marincola]
MPQAKHYSFIGAALLLLLIFSCQEKRLSLKYKSVPFQSKDYQLALNDSSMVEDWVYDAKDNLFASWNAATYSIDLYDLQKQSFQKRYFLFPEGPFGIGNVEALVFEGEFISAVDPVRNIRVKINLVSGEKELFRIVNPQNQSVFDDYNINIVNEFSSKPYLGDHHQIWPITPNEDFLSEEYYSGNVFLLDDYKLLGHWPKAYRDYYFGLLGEPSFSYSDSLLFLSFPVDQEVKIFDFSGEEQESVFLSSEYFNPFEGMTREEPDLQQETNMTITENWFLKTIYNQGKLIRFEKESQELKNINGRLNSKLFGKWRLVWIDLNRPEMIYTMDLPEKELFLPISFPYGNGILIKKITDQNEDFADFVFVSLDIQ